MISDADNLIKEYSEAKNKFVKVVDQKNFEALQQKMETAAEKEHTIIMDALAKFLSGNPDASYSGEKETFFKDHNVFGAAIRKIKPEKLS